VSSSRKCFRWKVAPLYECLVARSLECLHGVVFDSAIEGVGLAVERTTDTVRPPQLAIECGEPRELPPDLPAPIVTEWRDAAHAITMRVRGVGRFDIEREIIRASPAPGTREDTLRLFTRYHAVGLALRLHGLVVLHGAAVSVAGAAHVWVGASGAGKTCAALEACETGASFLADEVVAVEERAGHFIVRRGVPWPRVDAGAPTRLHEAARRARIESAAEVPLGDVRIPRMQGSAMGRASLAAQVLGGYRPELPPTREELALRGRLLDAIARHGS
jgi:hypothetical protein